MASVHDLLRFNKEKALGLFFVPLELIWYLFGIYLVAINLKSGIIVSGILVGMGFDTSGF